MALEHQSERNRLLTSLASHQEAFPERRMRTQIQRSFLGAEEVRAGLSLNKYHAKMRNTRGTLTDARELSIGWPYFPQLIVASIECILEDDGVLFEGGLADVECLPAEGVNDVLARVRRDLLHPESLAGTVGELLLNDARSVVFGLLLDGEGLSGGAQSEGDLSEVALGHSELLVAPPVAVVEDELPLRTLGHVQHQPGTVLGAERDVSLKQQRLLLLHQYKLIRSQLKVS